MRTLSFSSKGPINIIFALLINNLMKYSLAAFIITCSLYSCVNSEKEGQQTTEVDQKTGATKSFTTHYDEEKHLKNVRQITFGGDNAEAYWKFDGSGFVFQATNNVWDAACDQIFIADTGVVFKSDVPKRISTGLGRTTCAYYLPGDSTILYASTHLGSDSCPPKPEKREDGKYIWPVYADYDIFIANLNGEIISRLTDSPGYDAEATVSPTGDKIVFTSTRSGDLELFTMNIDGSDIKQITDVLGYDGGAFFSPDGKKLIFRASRPETDEEIEDYKQLLSEGLVEPVAMELFICNVDGSGLRQITHLGGANWAPFFHPSGQKVIFSSNHANEKGFPFNLFLINIDGSDLEQITWDGVFDAFPVFSPDGSKLIFSSNRNNHGTHETNLFMADWIE